MLRQQTQRTSCEMVAACLMVEATFQSTIDTLLVVVSMMRGLPIDHSIARRVWMNLNSSNGAANITSRVYGNHLFCIITLIMLARIGLSARALPRSGLSVIVQKTSLNLTKFQGNAGLFVSHPASLHATTNPVLNPHAVARGYVRALMQSSGGGGSGGPRGRRLFATGGGGGGGSSGGPSGPWEQYLALLESHPFITRAITCGILNGIGERPDKEFLRLILRAAIKCNYGRPYRNPFIMPSPKYFHPHFR